MGLNKGASAIYLNIVNGRLARRFKSPTPDTITRVNSENKTVHEEFYKSLDGMLVGLDIKTHKEYGDSLLVYIKSDQVYCVQMNMKGRYAQNFLKTLPNIKLEKQIEFAPFQKTVGDGKNDQTVFIRQDGVVLKRYYTKDTPELPEPVKKTKRGEVTWNWEPVIEFLEESVYIPFKEALKEKGGFNVPDPEAAPEPESEAPKDDLPF